MDDNSPVTHEPEEPGPSLKKSRRAVEKRVVSVPIREADGPRNKAGGETAAPTDSWAWRKYGQKPIKGSPYPRGYYRCSSSKGCPARKQVERSRADPTMLVVTYSAEHNHPWPLPKNHNHGAGGKSPAKTKETVAEEPDSSLIQPDPEEKFADLIAGDMNMLGGMEFGWFSDVGSPSTSSSPTDGSLLYGSIAGCSDAMLFPDEIEEKLGRIGGKVEEEDSLFAGLGELPECSVVFRRGFQPPAAAMAAASSG